MAPLTFGVFGHPTPNSDPKILIDTFARRFAGFSNDQELLTALRAAPPPATFLGCGHPTSFEIGMRRMSLPTRLIEGSRNM